MACHENENGKRKNGSLLTIGEDIPAAVEREVLEETGVKAKFVALMCFRHLHNFRFGCDDMYFVSLMHPLTQTIKIDRREIDDARWMDVSKKLSFKNKINIKCKMQLQLLYILFLL